MTRKRKKAPAATEPRTQISTGNSSQPYKSIAERIREAPPDSPLVRRIRLTALGLLVTLLAVIFAVPQRDSPTPTLDNGQHAFDDRIGLVSEQYAQTTAAALMNDPRFQLAVYVDTAPPDGRLSSWASERATAWRIGTQDDNGIVLFVFRDAHLARAEVGYGLEDRLPDALVRRLLEDRLAPRFASGDYEAGLDAFIKSIGDALGGDEAMHRLWLELGGKPRKGTTEMLLDTYVEGMERAPRMIETTWRTYIEGGAGERIFVLICTGIFLTILAAAVAVAFITISIAIKLVQGRPDVTDAFSAVPSHRATSSRARTIHGLLASLFGVLTVALFSALLLFALSLIGEQMHRQGDFSGAGAQVFWATAHQP